MADLQAGGAALSPEQGESHTFLGYCFLYNHLPLHGEPVLPKLCSLYKHCWHLDLQRFQKHIIVVSLEGLGAYSGPPLQTENFTFQFVHFFFLSYRLLVITLEKKVVLKCGQMSNILGDL